MIADARYLYSSSASCLCLQAEKHEKSREFSIEWQKAIVYQQCKRR